MYNQHLGKLGCTFNVPKRTKRKKKNEVTKQQLKVKTIQNHHVITEMEDV